MRTETDTVQTAMFAAMSDAERETVTAGGPTNVLTSLPAECPLGPYLSKYGVTKYYYNWTSDGDVTCVNMTP